MKTFLIGALAAAGLALASQAHATVYTLTDDHCTGTCGGLASYGTITVTGTTTLDISIQLAAGVTFNGQGVGLDTVSWNLVGNPLISISGLPADWGANGVQAAGTHSEDGFGNWDYVVNEVAGNHDTHVEYFVTGSGANAGNTLTLDPNFIDNQN